MLNLRIKNLDLVSMQSKVNVIEVCLPSLFLFV